MGEQTETEVIDIEPAEPSKRQRAAAEAAATMDLMPFAGETDVLRSLYHLADAVKGTEFVPQGLRGDRGKVLAAILTGRELGIGPMAALKHIGVVSGRPILSAELQLALVRRDGHRVTGQSTFEKAEVHGERGDTGETMDVTWDLDMAIRAGLVDKLDEEGRPVALSNNGKPLPWQLYPQAMLWARAVTQLTTQLFADVVVGGMPTRMISEPQFEDR